MSTPADPGRQHRLWARAEAAAAVLGPLALPRPQGRRRGGQEGIHRSRVAGEGRDFWQFRPLEPGESREQVDWRRSARSDALYVRTHEREQPARLLLWVDPSPSMAYASAPGLPTKADHARLLAGALCAAVARAGERVAALGEARAASPRLVFEHLSGVAVPDLRRVPLAAGDRLLLASDFLDPAVTDAVAALAVRDAPGLLLQVADPAEISFPFTGRVALHDLDPTATERVVDAGPEARARYLAVWQAHLDRVAAAARAVGWQWRLEATDRPLSRALADAARALVGP